MMKILAIGNSFSQDAMAYLHDMAQNAGMEAEVANLYIGGCSLCTHWENAQNDAAAYSCERNGQITGRMVSIKEALTEDGWDIVTLQQASYDSGMEQTYHPYITLLSEYVRRYCAGAKQMVHQTWAYESDSTHPAFQLYGGRQDTMYQALCDAYQNAAQELHLEIIPSGDVIQTLRALEEFDYPHGGQSLCRDGFHMHLIYGRYAVAATWYEVVMHGNILTNDYRPPVSEIPVDEKRLEIIAQTVHRVCQAQRAGH